MKTLTLLLCLIATSAFAVDVIPVPQKATDLRQSTYAEIFQLIDAQNKDLESANEATRASARTIESLVVENGKVQASADKLNAEAQLERSAKNDALLREEALKGEVKKQAEVIKAERSNTAKAKVLAALWIATSIGLVFVLGFFDFAGWIPGVGSWLTVIKYGAPAIIGVGGFFLTYYLI